jgi:hypothetical protein
MVQNGGTSFISRFSNQPPIYRVFDLHIKLIFAISYHLLKLAQAIVQCFG